MFACGVLDVFMELRCFTEHMTQAAFIAAKRWAQVERRRPRSHALHVA
jgi:hypothetical protein